MADFKPSREVPTDMLPAHPPRYLRKLCAFGAMDLLRIEINGHTAHTDKIKRTTFVQWSIRRRHILEVFLEKRGTQGRESTSFPGRKKKTCDYLPEPFQNSFWKIFSQNYFRIYLPLENSQNIWRTKFIRYLNLIFLQNSLKFFIDGKFTSTKSE